MLFLYIILQPFPIASAAKMNTSVVKVTRKRNSWVWNDYAHEMNMAVVVVGRNQILAIPPKATLERHLWLAFGHSIWLFAWLIFMIMKWVGSL